MGPVALRPRCSTTFLLHDLLFTPWAVPADQVALARTRPTRRAPMQAANPATAAREALWAGRFGPLGCLAGLPGPDVITAPHPAACLRSVVHVADYATYVGWADSLEHRITLLPDLVDTSGQAALAAVRVIDTTHLTPAEAALRIAEAVKG